MVKSWGYVLQPVLNADKFGNLPVMIPGLEIVYTETGSGHFEM